MVVIKEFYPCQRDYVFKYAEQKRIEKEMETKRSREPLQPEIPDTSSSKTTRSMISSTIDFDLFLKETERHLMEAKQFGHQLTSIHNAVQDLNNLKSSDVLERLRAGRVVAERVVDHSGSVPSGEVERYANGTIVENVTNDPSKRRLTSPVSIASLAEFKLHGRIRTTDFHNYHLSNREKKRSVTESSSQQLNRESQCKLQKKQVLSKERRGKRTEEITGMKKKCQSTSQLRQLTPRVPVCPPKVKEMLEQVKQRKCSNNRVALPISVLNLTLI